PRSILQPQRGATPPATTPLRRQSIDVARRTDPLTLYDYSLSPHGRRLCILMREKGLTWQTVDIDLGRLEHKASAFLALNPNGELPVLSHGARVICDSALIAEYLDRLYPGVPFYPDDAHLAAQVRMWLALEAGAHKELRPLFWLHVVRPRLRAAGIGKEDVDAIVPASVDAAQRDWLRSVLAGTPRFDSSEELAREIVRKKLDVVERRLGGREYLVDRAVTMADVAWFTRVDLLPQLGIAHDRARHPNLLRWLEHLRARPSFAGAG
ncbi:MAG: glutathione S-transferase family protein, partial [Candidatus Binatia bacterium]